MPAEPDRRVAVIGAGAAGLVTARELLRAGLQPTVFEADADVGGIWRYTDDTEADPLGQSGPHIHGSLYASLRTNLPIDLMAFTDFPLEAAGIDADAVPRFPGHRVVHDYLQRFAAHFGLLPHVRPGTRVLAVRPDPGAAGRAGPRWRVAAACARPEETPAQAPADPATEETFAAVAVCSGHYSVPRVPPLPGDAAFPGLRMHSHNYRVPAPFAGKAVALWGMSASGTDLAREIAGVARRVYWCGAGTAMAPAAPPAAPDDVLQRGADVVALDPDGCVRLADGTRTGPVDVFVYCTGYHYRYPFLDDHVLGVDDNAVGPLYRDLLHCDHATLALVGVPFRVVPFPLFEVQARYLAKLWSGGFQPPAPAARMAHRAARIAALQAAGVKRRHWHQRSIDAYRELDELADEGGVPRLPDWHRELTRTFMAHVQRVPGRYREVPFPRVDRAPARAVDGNE